MLLKKEKFKAVIYCSSARELNQPTAYSRAARFRVPGRNLGLGRDSSLPPRPNSARALRAVDRDPTVVREDRRNKTPSRPLPQTLGLTLFLCFSLFAALHTTATVADDFGTGATQEMALPWHPSPAHACGRSRVAPSCGTTVVPFGARAHVGLG